MNEQLSERVCGRASGWVGDGVVVFEPVAVGMEYCRVPSCSFAMFVTCARQLGWTHQHVSVGSDVWVTLQWGWEPHNLCVHDDAKRWRLGNHGKPSAEVLRVTCDASGWWRVGDAVARRVHRM